MTLSEDARDVAVNIVAAPDEWTPNYTRSELLPLAKAYLALTHDEPCSSPASGSPGSAVSVSEGETP